MQEKITQTSIANSEHKHFEIERFSTLNEQVITFPSYYSIIQSSELKKLRHCQLSASSVACTNQSL